MRIRKSPRSEKTKGLAVLSNSFSALTADDFFDTKERRKMDEKLFMTEHGLYTKEQQRLNILRSAA